MNWMDEARLMTIRRQDPARWDKASIELAEAMAKARAEYEEKPEKLMREQKRGLAKRRKEVQERKNEVPEVGDTVQCIPDPSGTCGVPPKEHKILMSRPALVQRYCHEFPSCLEVRQRSGCIFVWGKKYMRVIKKAGA